LAFPVCVGEVAAAWWVQLDHCILLFAPGFIVSFAA
jgi:hypothetical protein